jgi:hypothetical protein
MIRAADARALAAANRHTFICRIDHRARHERAAAMTTDVEERAQHAVVSAHDEHHIDIEIVARRGQDSSRRPAPTRARKLLAKIAGEK